MNLFKCQKNFIPKKNVNKVINDNQQNENVRNVWYQKYERFSLPRVYSKSPTQFKKLMLQ